MPITTRAHTAHSTETRAAESTKDFAVYVQLLPKEREYALTLLKYIILNQTMIFSLT